MNYPDDVNYNKMCRIFVKLIKHYNPVCNLFILHENKLPEDVAEYINTFTNVKCIYAKSDNQSWSDHHNIKYKLFNLTKIKEPFIFLDSDIFCLSSLDHLWDKRNDKPFIGINHQHIPGHTDAVNFKFLNSGVQIVGDPEWYQYYNFRDMFRIYGQPTRWAPGWDQAHIFRYCECINYDYTHPDIGYEWNSCSKYGDISYEGDEWICTYNGPSDDEQGIDTYRVKLNHYWWTYKPWQINCPIFKSIENE